MRRDAGLLRRLVLTIAEAPYGWDVAPIDAHERQTVAWHVALLVQDGLATAIDTTARTQSVGFDFINVRLTARGCDLASLMGDETRWQHISAPIVALLGADAPVALLYDALLAAARRELGQE